MISENLQRLKEWGYLLSDTDFNKYAEEFDSVIDGFLEYADEGYELSFKTAYGMEVRMTYDDYTKKNEKYQEFIHGLPRRGLFFTSSITMPYEYKVLQSLLEDVQASVDRISDLGWVMKKFEVNGFKIPFAVSIKPYIVVSHEFERGNRG